MKREFFFGTVFAAAMAVGLGAQQTGTSTTSGQNNRGQEVTVTGCLQPASEAGGSASGSMTGSTAGTTSGSTASGTSTSGSTTGTSGTTSGTQAYNASGARYILTNVSMGSDNNASSSSSTTNPTTAGSSSSTAGSTAGTTGATGTSGSSADTNMMSSTLWLSASGDKDSNWSKYVNHRVQVRGTLENGSDQSANAYGSSSSGSMTGSTAGTTGSTAGTTGSTSGEPTGSTASGTMTGSTAGTGSQTSPNSQAKGTLRVNSIKDLGSCSGSGR